MLRKAPFVVRKRRVARQGRVRVQAGEGQSMVCNYLDLSVGGLFVETLFPAGVGEIVGVETKVFGILFKTTARVAWVRAYDGGEGAPAGMGLEFLELSPAQRKVLYRQVDESVKHGGRVLSGRSDRARSASGAVATISPALSKRTGGRSAVARREGFWSRFLRPGG